MTPTSTPVLFTNTLYTAPPVQRSAHQTIGRPIDGHIGDYPDGRIAEFCGPLMYALGGGAQHHPGALRDELACDRCTDAARRSGAGHDRHPVSKARDRVILGSVGQCRLY